MAFADILVGLAKRGREHKINLMEMEHEDNVQQAKIFAQLAESDNFEPEQKEKFLEISIGLLGPEAAKYKKDGIKNGKVQIPVRDMLRPWKPLASAEAAELKPGENIELPLAMKPPTFLPQAPAAAKAIESAGPELLRKGQIPIPEGIGEISAPATMPGGLASKQPRNIRTMPGSASSDILLPPAAPPPAWTPIGQPISPQTQAFRKNQAAADLEEIKETSRRANDARDAAAAAALQKQKDEAAAIKNRETIAGRVQVAGMSNAAKAELVRQKGLQPIKIADDLLRDGVRYIGLQALDPDTNSWIYYEQEAGDPKTGPQSQSPMSISMRAVKAANPGIDDAQARSMIMEDDARSRAMGTASVMGVPLASTIDASGAPINITRKDAPGTPQPKTLYQPSGSTSVGGVPGVSLAAPPTVSDTTQNTIAGFNTSIGLIEQEVIPLIKKNASTLGPVLGRITLGETALGGYGLTDDQIRLVTTLQRNLSSQAFSEGGKQLTPTELIQFEKVNPKATDTLQQAMINAELSLDFLKRKRDERLAVMPVRQQQQIPNAGRGATTPTPTPTPVPAGGNPLDKFWK